MATETFELRIQGLHSAQYVENVIHVRGNIAVPGNTAHDSDLAIAAWEAALRTKWLDMMPGSYTLSRLYARRVDPPFSIGAHKQYQLGAHSGTRAGDCTSYNLCPVIRLVPIMGTKSVGKMFLACISNTDIEDNQYTAGYQAAVDAYMTIAATGYTVSGDTWKQVVKSRKYASIANIDGWTISPRIGYQSRRRYPQGG